MRTVYTQHPRDASIRLIQFRRSPSDTVIEAEITLPDGARKIVSTREREMIAAAFAASEMKVKLLNKIAGTGSAALRRAKLTGPTFRDAANEVIAKLTAAKNEEARQFAREPARVATTKARKYGLHEAAIKTRLLSAFGDLTYSEVTISRVATFLDGLTVDAGPDPNSPDARLTKRPAQSTVGQLGHTYSLVMEHLRAKSNSDVPFPRMSKSGFPHEETRGSFEPDDIRRIISHMSEDWIESTAKARNRLIRRLMRAYVHIAASSGIRPGLEATRLQYRQIRTVGHITTISIMKSQAKYRRAREAVVNAQDPIVGIEAALRDLEQVHGNLQASTLLFALPSGEVPEYTRTFKGVLDTLGLYWDPVEQQPRTLYSLRHYYANTMIVERNVDIYKLAKAMGTSVKMIEDYYARALDRRAQATLAGVNDRMGMLRGALKRSKLNEDDPLTTEEHDEAVET